MYIQSVIRNVYSLLMIYTCLLSPSNTYYSINAASSTWGPLSGNVLQNLNTVTITGIYFVRAVIETLDIWITFSPSMSPTDILNVCLDTTGTSLFVMPFEAQSRRFS